SGGLSDRDVSLMQQHPCRSLPIRGPDRRFSACLPASRSAAPILCSGRLPVRKLPPDSIFMLDQVFGQSLRYWHVRTQTEQVLWIVWVYHWIVERMSDCASPRNVQVTTDVVFRCSQISHTFVRGFIGQQRKRPVDPRNLRGTIRVPSVDNLEIAEK